MRWLGIVIAMGIVVSGFAEKGFAAAYRCIGEGYKARVGAAPPRRVTIEHRKNESLCLFSVDGWPASSPRLKKVEEAIKELNKVFSVPPGQKPIPISIEKLGFVLAAATPERSPPGKMRSLLKQFTGNIHKCIEDFIAFGKNPPFPNLTDIPVGCGGFFEGSHEIGNGISFSISGGRTFVIAVKTTSATRALFIPYLPVR